MRAYRLDHRPASTAAYGALPGGLARALLLLAATLFPAAPSWPQEPVTPGRAPRGAPGEEQPGDPRRLSAQDVAAVRLDTGDAVIITGRYKELIDRELTLTGCAARLTLGSKDLVRELLQLTANRDNVSVEGVVTASAPTVNVRVNKIWLSAPDTQLFARDLQTVLSRPSADWQGGVALLSRMLQSYEGCADPAVEQQMAFLFERLPEKAKEPPSPEAIDAWTAAVQRLHSVVGNKTLTVSALSALEKVVPGNRQVLDLLEQLKTRKYRGRWVTQEEFKALEGFTEYQDRFVLPREKDLVEAVHWYAKLAATDLILRRRTDPEYRLLAEKGQLEVGMSPEEAVRAIGFADRVERRSFQQKEYTQWIYPDRYLHFRDAVLYRITPRS